MSDKIKDCLDITQYRFLFFYKSVNMILSKYNHDDVIRYLKIVGLLDDSRIIENDSFSNRKLNTLGFSVKYRLLVTLGCLEGYNFFYLPRLYYDKKYNELVSWNYMINELTKMGKVFVIK